MEIDKEQLDILKRQKEAEIKSESELIFDNEFRKKLSDKIPKQFKRLSNTILLPLMKESFVAGNLTRYRLENKEK